ncbi:putative suppressor of action mutation 2-like protein [Kockovaella imperatae]|uniref:Putative suppressor of action mutation 2-like protein n=1 Tax=Kockovaella imperatae TaxID=4999 RepID=A0A1Y1UK42_9TREE|nr:putative suppressor of action mutation 2-like protein [Kockovaella imperatae]ORX38430.1 putative suppressor of action mutation 2-like protein [Kockovaella imperatae]
MALEQAKSIPNGVHDLDGPEAGPSRPKALSPSVLAGNDAGDDLEESENLERLQLLKCQDEYLELRRSVQASTELLSGLSSYLSTFQNDLSAVSGQVSELQDRSSAIDAKLQGRKAVLPSLSALVDEILLPPSLTETIRDTKPSSDPETWLVAIAELERRLSAVKARRKVKATQQVIAILEGLRAKALEQLPPFLLSLIRPLKSASTGLSTNLAVLQTSVLLKYQPFFSFLRRESPPLAKQVERGYVNAARAYFETGMRRYTRALGQIKVRTVEKPETFGSSDVGAANGKSSSRYDRLRYANLDVEGEEGSVVLAYMADDKDFRVPLEALFRSLSLVLLDNASAEFTFIVRFFSRSASTLERPTPSRQASRGDEVSESGSRISRLPRQQAELNDDFKDAERIWHEVFDSAMEYVSTFFDTYIVASPPPPAVQLLTMIRLNDRLLEICEARGTLPLESYLQRQKLSMWPIFRKELDGHIDTLKKLADGAEGKGALFGSKGVKDATIRQAAMKYASLFSSVTALSEEADEAMIYSSMSRMRTELVRLTQTQASKIKNPSERHSFTSSIYEVIMHELVAGPGTVNHPRIQSELSFFRTREEEARRRMNT